MKIKALWILAALGLLITMNSFAQPFNGRSLTADGTVQTLDGTLSYQEGATYLETADHTRYLVHPGPYFYKDRIAFKAEDLAGKRATIKGYVNDKNIAPVSIQVDGQQFAFRTDDGLPLWRGQGRGPGNKQGNMQGKQGTGFSGMGRGNCGGCRAQG